MPSLPPQWGAGFAAKGDFENMVTYSTAHGYKPDYLYLMQRMMMDNPEAAVSPPTKVGI